MCNVFIFTALNYVTQAHYCVTKSSEGRCGAGREETWRRRPGAGRKYKYGVKTIVMRVPEDRVQEVQDLIGGGGLESVTELKAEPIEKIRRIVEVWGEKLIPHQDASGQVKQPRWEMCWELA